MKLKKLLKNFPTVVVKGSRETEITGICADSRRVAPGNLFIARKGAKYDGSQYILTAVASGACAILTDLFDPSLKNTTQLIAPDIAFLESAFASAFYHYPSRELLTIGITGTNGKTTTSFLIRYLLENLQKKTPGLIGTIEYVIGDKRYQATHTTPDSCTLQKLLREILQSNGSSVVMEVTSHALDQKRSAEVEFDIAVFTNLTQDHLDYHKTMQDYALAKQKLFSSLTTEKKPTIGISKCAVVNADDPYSKLMIEGCPARVMTYGIDQTADLFATECVWSGDGTECVLNYRGVSYKVSIPLVGRFNLYNVLAAIGVVLAAGFPMEKITALLPQTPSVPGRLEKVSNEFMRRIFVDFAHTPDSLQKALETLRPLTPGRLIIVFGCGGDRDRSKRPLMAAVCEKSADLLVITSDNPRSEDPREIIREILAGIKHPESCLVLPDRKEAISQALRLACDKDTILIAGKGHEKFQIIGNQTIPFDDVEVAKQMCQSLSLSFSD